MIGVRKCRFCRWWSSDTVNINNKTGKRSCLCDNSEYDKDSQATVVSGSDFGCDHWEMVPGLLKKA